jgi:CheY-like chemotaxis protein
VQLGADTIRQHGMAIEPGTYLRLSVQDTGAGIAPDVRNRIFEPFFTTKAAGKGTGLGLAAVWGMVRAHNAGVQVDTAPGQGTSFHLYFRPHVGQDAGPKAEPAQQLVMGHGHILVVDDEANLRELVGTMLGALGYEVTLAEDGVHALEVFRQAPARFDLVLLDMTMPRMNGHDTFAALRQVRADVRVLLTSGYVESSDLDSALALGATGVLNKPFDLSELSREVDASLARRRRVKR